MSEIDKIRERDRGCGGTLRDIYNDDVRLLLSALDETEAWLCRECGRVNMFSIAPSIAELRTKKERLESAIKEAVESLDYDLEDAGIVREELRKALAPDEEIEMKPINPKCKELFNPKPTCGTCKGTRVKNVRPCLSIEGCNGCMFGNDHTYKGEWCIEGVIQTSCPDCTKEGGG